MFKLEGLGTFLVEGRDLGWVGAGRGGWFHGDKVKRVFLD